MVDIRPFRGLRYNEARIEGLDRVTCPPYDVISDTERDGYYVKSEYNIVRLVLGKVMEGDSDHQNRYTRASRYLSNWIEKGILVRDDVPSIYVYEQTFKAGAHSYSRLGFIALVKLQEFSEGGILPHERTLSKPKEDRLRLMRACNTNLSQIFGIYSEPECSIDGVLSRISRTSVPVAQVTDEAGVVNRMWAVSDPAVISDIASRMRDRQVFIADGHHRYETALAYRNELRSNLGDPDSELPCDFTMMMFVNMESPGLVVFPTHRLVYGITEFDPERLLMGCRAYFEVEEVDSGLLADVDDMTASDFLHEIVRANGHIGATDSRGVVFGVYLPGKRFYLLKLGDPSKVDQYMDQSRSVAWRRLDVSILHSLVIGRVMGIGDEAQLMQTNLRYTRSLREAIARVDSGEAQASLLLNPTKVSEVSAVAKACDTMPQKSTYFYPKLLTGLVMNPLS